MEHQTVKLVRMLGENSDAETTVTVPITKFVSLKDSVLPVKEIEIAPTEFALINISVWNVK